MRSHTGGKYFQTEAHLYQKLVSRVYSEIPNYFWASSTHYTAFTQHSPQEKNNLMIFKVAGTVQQTIL